MSLQPDVRQFPVVAYLEFAYTDIPTTATAYTAVALPVGSIVTALELYVTTSWNGGTHDLDIGDATDPDEYTPTISELDGAAGRPANVPVTTGFQTTLSEPAILFTPAHSTAADAGAARFWCEYITETRAHENYE